MRVYLSGPMTGHADFNVPAFDAAAAWLRTQDYQVVSPPEIVSPRLADTTPYTQYLREDFRKLLDCDAIVLLPGWPRSRGSRAELSIAMDLELGVGFLHHNPMFIAWMTGDPKAL